MDKAQACATDSRRFPDNDARPTPRTDALWATWEKDEHGVTKYAAMYLLARQLERDLEVCRDAHMANCLASDTLRDEIHALREQLSAPSETRRSPKDIIAAIVADLCSRKGLSHEWDAIDEEIREEIVAEWLTFFAEPDNAMGEQLVYSLNEAQSEQFLKAMQEHREPTPTMIAGRKRLKELSAPSARVAPLAPKDANGKRPRLFYFEDAEGCWCPADGYDLAVENIIDVDSFMSDGEVIAIEFKRQDMTDEEHAAIPEG